MDTGKYVCFDRLIAYLVPGMSIICPCISGASISGDEGPSIAVNDTAVETTILLMDEDGALVRKKGIMMVF